MSSLPFLFGIFFGIYGASVAIYSIELAQSTFEDATGTSPVSFAVGAIGIGGLVYLWRNGFKVQRHADDSIMRALDRSDGDAETLQERVNSLISECKQLRRDKSDLEVLILELRTELMEQDENGLGER